jgi:plastocyanin
MHRNRRAHLATPILGIITLLVVMPSARAGDKLSESEAHKIGVDAYIYGYPLVTMEMTRRVMTNVAEPKGSRGPMGQFVNMRKYPTAEFKDVTAPNADTLYSAAWLDLAKEPYVLSLPDEGDRYYLMPMLSGWTDVFADPGTRTTGTKTQTYAITGPNWKGALPDGVKELKSPTNMVWIIGRTYCSGTPEDYKAVHALQDKYKLVPLGAYGKDYTPPRGKVDPDVDMKTPVRDQVNNMKAGAYFKLLARLMKDNPPAKADADLVAKLKKIGIEPGKDFDISKLDPAVAKGLETVAKPALEKIVGHLKEAGKGYNGWVFPIPAGVYGTDYIQRATITYFGLGANRTKDAVYPTSQVDAGGKPYNGANHYTMTFPKGQLPPVDGFWSLTMYDADYFFVDNKLNRYTLSPRNKLKQNEDGSVTLYLQNQSPGTDKESNWLPAPKGKFVLMLRLYWPKEKAPSILDGTWKPPAVTRVNTTTPPGTGETPDKTPGKSPAKTITVTLNKDGVSQNTVEVRQGTKVFWSNRSGSNQTVTSDTGLWNSGPIPPGYRFDATFQQPGSYPYHSETNPKLRGIIVVR